MKKFAHSSKGQFRALAAIAANPRVKASATVADQIDFLAHAYRDYLRNRGNPWTVAIQLADEEFRETMKGLFGSKAAAIKYISDLRRATKGRCCSMCGSHHSSQIDHFLPQFHYPEFSVFLPNLYPICTCNQAKGNKTMGPAPGERFLHPKFDRKIGERSLFVRIRNHDVAPTYTVIKRKPKGVRDTAAFEFHTRTLVSTDGLSDHVKDGFERFVKRPGSLVRHLKRADPQSKAELAELFRDEIEESCVHHRTKNNWDSVMFHALLERRTLDWLWKRFDVQGRKPGKPLISLL